MKKILNKMLLAGFFSLILLTNLGQTALAAGTGTMSMTPASGNYNNGDTIAVKIYEDSGTDNVNAVQANFNYPASTVSFVSFDFAGSAFGIAIQADSATPGTIKIGRGQIGGVTGSSLIGTVNFKIIQANSTANLNFDESSSKVMRSSDNQPETLAFINASYSSIATPAPTPTPNPTPSPTPSPTPTSSPTTTKKTTTSTKTPATTTPTSSAAPTLTISDILVQNVSGTTATITWTTSLPATSNIDYGPDSNYIFNSSDSTVSTTHSVTLDSKNLNANSTYHYRVSSVDAAGQVATGPDSTFSTGDDKSIIGFGTNISDVIKKNGKLIAAAASVMALAMLAFVAAHYIRHMHTASLYGAHGLYTPASSLPPSAVNNIPSDAIILAGGTKPQPQSIPVATPPQAQHSATATQAAVSPKTSPAPAAKQSAKLEPVENLVVFTDNPAATIKPKSKSASSNKPAK